MLTIPDLKQKQILFLNTSDGEGEKKIRFENDHIVYEVGGEVVNRASCQKLIAVFTIGNMSITSVLIEKAVSFGVSLFFMTRNLKVYAVIGAYAEANYLLRARQYAISKEQELQIARKIVFNKFLNQSVLLGEREKSPRVTQEEMNDKVNKAKDFQVLLGIEGSFSKEFFGNYFEEIDWWRREPRTKQDIPNVLLDLGYTLLFNLVDSFLRLHGFDTYKGVYHHLFFARKSLVCDIVEPMRCLIDKQILKSYNLKQIDRKDFTCKKARFSIKIDKNKKYVKIFSQMLMDNRENMYRYVNEYYRHVMNEKENPMPVFKIGK